MQKFFSLKLLPVLLLVTSLACNTVTNLLNTPTAPLAPTVSATNTAQPAPATDVPTPAPVLAGCENIPPATVPPATAIFEPTPDIAPNSAISTEVQLRVFNELVSVVEEVYVYPDFNGLDWQSIVATYRAKVEAGLETETFYMEMDAMIADLEDEHSHFESPSQVQKSTAELQGTLDYVGIGILVLPLPELGKISIISVFPGSPAELAGLKPHDSLLAVDGRPLVEDGVAYPRRVRGPECSAAVITVQSPGQPPRDLTIVRHRINSSLPIEARLVPTNDGSRIGYILLPTFYDETIPRQVEQAMQDFGELDGLILDNRVNSGGASTVVQPILSLFYSGTLGHFVSRSGSRELAVRANPIHNSQTVPLVILVSPDTVSFGEIFSGALKDVGRATIVGQLTLGNVETLHAYDFEDGSRVWIAEETFDPVVSHENWEQDGIVPDVEVIATWDSFTFETDPAIAAALAVLGHK